MEHNASIRQVILWHTKITSDKWYVADVCTTITNCSSCPALPSHARAYAAIV